MIKKLIKNLLNTVNALLAKSVRVYLIQFPTVLASVAMPSSTVPAPYKTPRAVPHEVIPKSEKIKITTLMEYIEMINDKIFVI